LNVSVEFDRVLNIRIHVGIGDVDGVEADRPAFESPRLSPVLVHATLSISCVLIDIRRGAGYHSVAPVTEALVALVTTS
jgi:hypothetical protein